MVGGIDPQGRDKTGRVSPVGPAASPAYSVVQDFLLRRLAFLVLQRQRYLKLIDAGDWRLKLLGKAIYSTYCDCVEAGIGEDAKRVFQVTPEAPSSQ